MRFAPPAWFTMVSDADLEKLTSTRVLVAGDIMLDRYWFGDVDRISPEAPVPVVAVNSSQVRPGGAANVAMNVCALGGNCTLLGIVGDDTAGSELEQIVSNAGIRHEFTLDPAAATSVKQRIISRNQQLLRVDFENRPGGVVASELTGRAKHLLAEHDVLVLSDYGKGALGQCHEIIVEAVRAAIPVLVDPKGTDFSRYQGATMVTPNLKEFEAVGGVVADDSEMTARANELLARYNIDQLLVTLSERGMNLFRHGQDPLHCPARSREVYDVSGAGDTVIAVMAMCVAAGLEASVALRIANSAAGVVVSRLGTATATMGELIAAIQRDWKP
jgi:D-beta-D-heptose 7-phosphate kinase/D-beta-D-heptose 1-phosphate adenosyltransferase